ncbi:MAG: hypothetical protein U9Q07_12005 [Planctomycetota bacterium]|nr:hypothetical protein [Planctomycetota bacterium]
MQNGFSEASKNTFLFFQLASVREDLKTAGRSGYGRYPPKKQIVPESPGRTIDPAAKKNIERS